MNIRDRRQVYISPNIEQTIDHSSSECKTPVEDIDPIQNNVNDDPDTTSEYQKYITSTTPFTVIALICSPFSFIFVLCGSIASTVIGRIRCRRSDVLLVFTRRVRVIIYIVLNRIDVFDRRFTFARTMIGGCNATTQDKNEAERTTYQSDNSKANNKDVEEGYNGYSCTASSNDKCQSPTS
jgi:hypothetical protein